MSPTVQGALVGLLGGLGVLLVVTRLRARRTTLDQRIAPYLRPRRGSRLLDLPVARGPFSTLERLVAPVLDDGVRLVSRVGSPTVDLRNRLTRASARPA